MSSEPVRSFVPVAPADRPRRTRRTARVLLIDDRDQILLFADSDPGIPGSGWWITPGGGIDQGESDLDAAVRELEEETGVRISAEALVGPILVRPVVHGYSDVVIDQEDVFFACWVPAFEVTDAGHTEEERLTMTAHRWWTRTELAATTEEVWPVGLVDLWADADRRRGAAPLPPRVVTPVEESSFPASPAHELYRAIVDDVFTAYAEGRLGDGLARLDAVPDGLDDWQAELAYHRACLLGASGAPDAALAALRASVTAGGWWDPEVLRGEDDLSALHGRSDFADLVATSASRWEEGQTLDRSGDVVLEPAGARRGLLVALHGADEDASDAAAAWGAARDAGFAVLAVRSSRRTSPSYRTWGPDARSATDLADALATHGVEPGEHLVVAGFSAGGRIALDWALRCAPVPVTGVIAVAPAVATADLPPVAPGPRLDPARILVGREDDLLEDVLAVGECLTGAGFRTEVLDGVGHEVPADQVRQSLSELAGRF